MRFSLTILCALAIPCLGDFTIEALDTHGADNIPEALVVDTPWYAIRFDLTEQGSARSMIYKPLDHELRAENYYSNYNNLFREWIRVAEPDPDTGHTRRVNNAETKRQTRRRATHRVVAQSDDELILEFTWQSTAADDLPWLSNVTLRRRITLRRDTPLVRVSVDVISKDDKPRPILFDAYNSIGLGRVQSAVYMPGAEGKLTGTDLAEEKGSRFLFAPEPSGAWIGGVNAEGLGGAFSYDWLDVDAMAVNIWKTVGSTYHVAMRRRMIEPKGTISFQYTFMPVVGMDTLDGMANDLAGGMLVGEKADYLHDVNVEPGETIPVTLKLFSAIGRKVVAHLKCVRLEDKQVVLETARDIPLTAVAAAVATFDLTLTQHGLYELRTTVTRDGEVLLDMAKPVAIGKTRMFYVATAPAGEKRGERDAGFTLGSPSVDEQFRTIDRNKVTPHLPVLANHAKGPIQVFFLTPADSTLGHVREIAQRAEMDYGYFAVTKIQTPRDALNQQELRKFRGQLADADADVLVALAVNWHQGLKRRTIQDILARVEEDGLGLVTVARSIEKQPELAEVLERAQEVKDDSPLPACAVGFPEVRRYQLGKGRIVLILCNWTYYRDGGEGALGAWKELRADGKRQHVPELSFRGYEYSYAMLGQLARWAADKSSPITIAKASRQSVTIVNGGMPADVALNLVARSPRWEILDEQTLPISLLTGESRHEFSLPDVGRAILEFSVRSPSDKLLAFASAGILDSQDVSIELESPLYRPAASPGSCRVTVVGKQGTRGTLAITIVDRFGRHVARQDQAIATKNGRAEVDLPLDTFTPMCVFHEILVDFHDNDGVTARGYGQLMLLPDRPPFESRFMLGVADGPERRALHMQGIIETTRAAGFTLQTHSHYDPVLYASGAYKGGHNMLRPTHDRYPIEGIKASLNNKQLIMTPPLVPDEDAIERTKQRWLARARRYASTGALILGLDDERRMSGDFDFHPQTLARFRTWLSNYYPDVDTLNRAWRTNYGNFEEVVPVPRDKLEDPANLAPWLVFRMFIGEMIGEYYMKLPVQWAKELGNIAVGEMGVYEPSASWPVDWSRYAGCYRHTGRYGSTQGVLEELFRSFSPETNHGQWLGYGMREISDSRRIAPWRSLLNGGHFAWYWAMVDSGFWNYGLNTSDQRMTAGYAALAKDEFPDLTGGIDRLIIASRFTHDGIAIGYSWPSWIVDSNALARQSKTVIENLGYQHAYVNLNDLSEQTDFHLLVIEHASCVSAEQAAAIERFAQQGGRVLVVGRSGWRNVDGSPHAGRSPLDEVLGIDTRNAEVLDRAMTVDTAPGSPRMNIQMRHVDVDGAEVLTVVQVDDGSVPVLTRRAAGNGAVYWLNARGLRSEDQPWQLFDNIIRGAGVTPRCRVSHDGQPIFGEETWYHASPSNRTLFVSRYLSKRIDTPARVHLAETAHIYDVRKQQYFGNAMGFEDAMPAGRMKVYALLPDRVEAVKLTATPDRVVPGETIAVRCMITLANAAPDLHAVRFSLSGPTGKALPAHDRVVLAPDGQVTADFPIALNATPGIYTLQATDIISGITSTITVQVQEVKRP